ncbi:MAG TPA: penicillin acylase family protein, partial [Chitinophagaceae bacterium]|nr:penicillin acylase family protein [Chitinophagaceae bacterium]
MSNVRASLLSRLYVSLFVSCIWVSFTNAQASKTEILWDSYGVPHVFGKSEPEMYYAFGWSQMNNHANLLLQLYAQARGKAAEYWGQDYLASDRLIHLFNIPGIAGEQYTKQDKHYKHCLDAFVDGVNAFAAAHPEAISAGNKAVLPVKPEDVIAHIIRVVYLQFAAQEDLDAVVYLARPGSNSLAIGPSRSASKNAMLVANPHLPWVDLYTFFEAHLQAPGFNAYGVSLVGMPVLNIAFNNNLGWTYTVNPIDIVDRYELTLSGDGYLLDGNITPFKKKDLVLKVKDADGTLQEQHIVLNYAEQGPVVTL